MTQFVAQSLFMSMHLILTHSRHTYHTKLTLFVLYFFLHTHLITTLPRAYLPLSLSAFSVQMVSSFGEVLLPLSPLQMQHAYSHSLNLIEFPPNIDPPEVCAQPVHLRDSMHICWQGTVDMYAACISCLHACSIVPQTLLTEPELRDKTI